MNRQKIISTLSVALGISLSVVRMAHAEEVINLTGSQNSISDKTFADGVTVNVTGNTTAYFWGSFVYQDDATVFNIENGSTLNLAYVVSSTGPGRVVVQGGGTLVISDASIDSTLAQTDHQKEVIGFEDRFAVDPEAGIRVKVTNLSMSGSPRGNSGKYVFGRGSDYSPDFTIETAGDTQVMFADPTGFDYETRLFGTKAVLSEGETGSLVVTETVRENETLHVPAGGKLFVYGAGLKASSKVVFDGAGSLVFGRTTALSAEVEAVSGTVSISTRRAGEVGDLAGNCTFRGGYVNVSSVAGTKLVFSGDMELGMDGSGYSASGALVKYGGDLEITGTVTSRATAQVRNGRVKICDGGHWKMSRQFCDLFFYLDGDACLEVGTNGTFEVEVGDVKIEMGGYDDHTATLLVNGGTFLHRHDKIQLAKNSTFELRSGIFTSGAPLYMPAATDHPTVIFGDATYQVLKWGTKSLFTGAGTAAVRVVGSTVFDVTDPDVFLEGDSAEGTVRATWTCEEGAVLAFRGKANGSGAFKIADFKADGLTVDLSPSAFTLSLAGLDDAVSLGWRTTGAAGSKVVALDKTPTLTAGYLVGAGTTFRTDSLPTGWYENFSLVGTCGNLVFENDSTLAFPCSGSAPTVPLALSGKLTLPQRASFTVDCQGGMKAVDSVPVITAAEVVDPGCAWTCLNGWRGTAALATSATALQFTYSPMGLLLIFR